MAMLALQTSGDVAIVGTEVQRRDRRGLATAGARAAALQPGADRARRRRRGPGAAATPASSASSHPAGASTSSSTSTISSPLRGADPGVAGRVAPRPGVEHQPAPRGARPRTRWPVVPVADDDHLGAGGRAWGAIEASVTSR